MHSQSADLRTCLPFIPSLSAYMFYPTSSAGFALPVAIVAKCEEKMFLAQKISFSENEWQKKILLKNQHLNITNFGYFMPLNRQLTS